MTYRRFFQWSIPLLSRFYCGILAAAFLLFCFALLIQPLLPHGDPAAAKELLLPWYTCHAAPEPDESIRYILLCLAAIPAALAGWILGKRFARPVPDMAGLLIVPLLILGGWIGKPYSVVLPGTVLLALPLWKYSAPRLPRFRRNWPLFVSTAALMMMTAARRFPNPAELENAFGDHMNIVLYALNSAVHGLPEIHLYGFYPAFLAPYLRLFGLSLVSAEFLMNLLYLAAFLLLADAARRLIRSNVLLLGFLMTAAFCCGNYFFLLKPGPEVHDPYFACWPVRFLFPVLGLNLLCRRNPSGFPLWSGILAAGAMWFNPDSGISVAAAFLAVHLFSGNHRRSAQFAGILVLAIPGWALLLRLLNGFWPDLPGYLRYMVRFWKAGYMMLPLEGPPVWLLSGLILLAGLLWSMRRFPVRPESFPVLYLTILGLGLFNYYVGRSHPWNLISCSWPELLLLFHFSDRLPQRFFGFRFPALFCGCAAIVTFGIRLPQITSEIRQTLLNFNAPCDSNYRVYKIRKITEKYQTVNLLPKYQQGFFYAETGLKPEIANFSTSEMLFKEDWTRIIADMRKSRVPLLLTGRVGLSAALTPFYRLHAVDQETGMILYMPVNRRAAQVPRPPAKP